MRSNAPRVGAKSCTFAPQNSNNTDQIVDDNQARPSASPDVRSWMQILTRYREPSHARSIVEIVITFGPLVALWAAAWAANYFGFWWLSLLIAMPAAGFLVRLFMIQHDCGHGAFFRHRLANDWVGRAIGVLTLTPYDFWRSTHAVHHASSGNLDRRGLGDVSTLTVREYLTLSWWGRLCYRLYRHPIVMFGIGPTYLFVLQQRLPIGMLRGGWRPWLSTMATNFAIALVVATLIWLIGIGPFLLVHLPIILIAGAIGVWLFFVQHQFDPTFWAPDGEWTLHHAALYGSSHYEPAGRPALVHRQHRPAPCPSPLQPHSLLPPAESAARSSGAARHRPIDHSAEPGLRAPRAVGRSASGVSFPFVK